jgi:hypothetical protein
MMTDAQQKRATRVVPLIATTLAAIVLIQCGGSPAGPSGASALSVTLNATNAAAGGSSQGMVSLAAPATTGGSNISLSSSNPAVASVQASVVVAAGASSVPFTITAVAAGTAKITASVNGSSGLSPTFTVTAGSVALASISLSVSSVVGGASVIGTATLTAPAPAGGASVALTGGDAASVPAAVVVPAGSASATFAVSTRAVGGTVANTIGGAYGGASASAVLSVTPDAVATVATASFGVTGATESDTCALADNGNTLNCTFNGSTSSAPGTIVAWDWTFSVAGTFAQTTSGSTLAMPATNCSLLPSPSLPHDYPWFPLVVTLTVHDSLGNVSAEASNHTARVFPNGACGF